MTSIEITTAELLTVLAAMKTAAGAYKAEAARTPLACVQVALTRKGNATHVVAASLKNRALNESDFARACRAANLV